jgi:hypothetical protein
MPDSLPTPPAAAPLVPSRPLTAFDEVSPATHPDQYDWLPVPRDRRRLDGWTPMKQREFIGAIADLGSVKAAAKSVRMSEESAYRLRRAPGGEAFARAWTLAIDEARHRVLEHALDRVTQGDEIEVRNRDGYITGYTRRYSDRLTMFLLRGYFQERFGPLDAPCAPPPGTSAVLTPAPLPTPAAHPVAEPAPALAAALDALLPPAPADVHLRDDADTLHMLAHGPKTDSDSD